ncbi:hypothetical protein KKA24_02395 [Patescibacteria group bacterium]|nr:hypothetical protein [Patescibacteria group bacterium]
MSGNETENGIAVEERTVGNVVEHRHDGFTYWHPVSRIHAEAGEGKLEDLDEPSIPIEEILEISLQEARSELMRQANVSRKGSNPSDAWALVNIETGEMFFAGRGLYIGNKASQEWRRIGWNEDFEE